MLKTYKMVDALVKIIDNLNKDHDMLIITSGKEQVGMSCGGMRMGEYLDAKN